MEDQELEERLRQVLDNIDSEGSSDHEHENYGIFAEGIGEEEDRSRRTSDPPKKKRKTQPEAFVINESKQNKFKLYTHDALFEENKKLKTRVSDLEFQLLNYKPAWVYEREIQQLKDQLKKQIKKSAQVQQALIERDNQLARIARMIGSVVSGLTQGKFNLLMVDENDEIEAEQGESPKEGPKPGEIWDKSVEMMESAIQALLDRLWKLERRNREMADENTKGSHASRRKERLRLTDLGDSQLAAGGIVSPSPSPQNRRERSRPHSQADILSPNGEMAQAMVEPRNQPPHLTPTYRELRKQRTEDHPKSWVPNDYSKHCMGCRSQFLFLVTSKHHCRRCGGLFCGSCSQYRDYVPPYYIDKKVRVCKDCHAAKDAERKERKRLFQQLRGGSGQVD